MTALADKGRADRARDRTFRLARHEAGHAVVALELGCGIERDEAISIKGGLGVCRTVVPPDVSAFDLAIVVVAGVAAEGRADYRDDYLRKRLAEVRSLLAVGDIEAVRAAMAESAQASDAFRALTVLAYCAPELSDEDLIATFTNALHLARIIVAKPETRASIEAVAARLAVVERLSGVEVAGLLHGPWVVGGPMPASACTPPALAGPRSAAKG